MKPFCRRALLACALAGLVAGPVLAHGEDDHGAAAAAPVGAAPRVVATSEQFELVGILGEGGALTLYLDRFADNAPVEGGRLTVTFDGTESVAEPAGPGLFRLTLPMLARPGHRDLTFSVEAGTDMDLLLGTLDVPEPAAEIVAPHGWLDALQEAPLLLLGGVGLLLAGAALGRLSAPRPLPPMIEADPPAPALPATARIGGGEAERPRRAAAAPVAALLLFALAPPSLAQTTAPPEPPRRLPDGAVFVPKPTQRLLEVRTQRAERTRADTTLQLVGTIVPDPNASGRVQPGQTGRLEAAEGGLPVLGQRVRAGQVLAYVTPAYSLSERGTLLQGIAELDQQIVIAEARANRLAGLRGSVSDREIQEARAELAGLRQRRAAAAPSLGGREALVAPVSGVVSVTRAALGGIVDSSQAVFEIVDPTRLWVEALAFDRTAQGTVAGASMVLPDGRTAPLELVGRGLSVRQQAVPLNFRMVETPPELSVGAPVTVLLRIPRSQEGVVLPADAVVRSAEGPPVAYLHDAAERFVPLPVRAEPLDGARVLVTAGIEPGARIVVRGAGLLAQVQ